MRFPEFNWATYNREFHQQAATTAVPQWSALDNTLWNLTRQSISCLFKAPITSQPFRSCSYEQDFTALSSACPPLGKAPVYKEWNESLASSCLHPFC